MSWTRIMVTNKRDIMKKINQIKEKVTLDETIKESDEKFNIKYFDAEFLELHFEDEGNCTNPKPEVKK